MACFKTAYKHEISSPFLGNTFHRPSTHTRSNLTMRLSKTSQTQNQGPTNQHKKVWQRD
jgi:hypothetical protein